MTDVLELMKAFPAPRVLIGFPALDFAFGELDQTKGTKIGTMNLLAYKLMNQAEEIRDIVCSNIKQNNEDVFIVEPYEDGVQKHEDVIYYEEHKSLTHLFMDDFPKIVRSSGKDGSVFIIRLSLFPNKPTSLEGIHKLEDAIYKFRPQLPIENKTVFFILGHRTLLDFPRGFTMQSDTETHIEVLKISNIKTTEMHTVFKLDINKNRGGYHGKTIYSTTQ